MKSLYCFARIHWAACGLRAGRGREDVVRRGRLLNQKVGYRRTQRSSIQKLDNPLLNGNRDCFCAIRDLQFFHYAVYVVAHRVFADV